MPDNNDALLKEIRDTYDHFLECWSKQREQAKNDTLLMANKPFTEQEIRRRGRTRPLVITDQVGQYTNQIINNIRQNPRGVNFQPKDLITNGIDAERRANIARGIEEESDAQAVYSTAFEGAVAYGGMGFMRLFQEYESVDTDRQILRLGRVPNHFSILPDPDCKSIDFSDMKRCFVLDSRRHADYLADYPNAKIREFGAREKTAYPQWIRENDLQIAEYWKVTTAPDVQLTLTTTTMRESQLPAGSRFEPMKDPAAGGIIHAPGGLTKVAKWRKVDVPSVWQYHTNGIEIVEKTLWGDNTSSIPIYPVVGREMFVDEGSGPKRQFCSAVRFISWAVKGMIYVRSLQTELAQMTPKTPYLAIEGQLEGMEGWKTLHTDPAAYLYYRAKLEQFGEVLLPPPGRVPYDPPIAQLEALYQAFHQDLQNGLGMYRASVGNQAGSTSGKMVQELDKQSDQGSFHFIHNFNQAVKRLWTDVNHRMDTVYDTVRDVPGLKPDRTPQVTRLNDPTHPDSLHMGKGEFTVSISVGPAMESETEDARKLTETLAPLPGVMEKVGDLLVKLNGKGPIVDEIAKRLAPAGVGDPQNPQQLQQQLQQAGQKLQLVGGQLQQATEMLRTKKIESDARVRVAMIGALAGIREAEIKAGTDTAQLDARMLEHATGLLADANTMMGEHAHEAAIQGADHAHAKEMAATPPPVDPNAPEPAANGSGA